MPIHFGTDGWRAVISDSFTFDNLRIVTQAIADAVASEHWDASANSGNIPDKNKIVVGYDTRFLSDRFAGEVARGIKKLSEAEANVINLVPEVYRGLDRFEARKLVVEHIDAEGLMIIVENKKVMQPFGDRSHVVIEPMLTNQWFADAAALAGPAIASVREGPVRSLGSSSPVFPSSASCSASLR